jgi:aerobic-type carbon monoxide dehydrogenase small subunit (CoxS/CutS family)
MGRMDNAHGKRPVEFFFNDQKFEAHEGESVAAALLAAGQRTLRKTPRREESRGLFCGMGICYDCVVCIDGQPNRQACLTPVTDGMRVEVQIGHGIWSTEQ